MPHNITSTDKVRAMGLKQYAEDHGWDYDSLITAFEKSMYDRRYSVSLLPETFRKKDGRLYSTQWMYELRKVYQEDKAKEAQA